ncbi:hypothetical protein NDI37_24370 [Funiculus sociatus GB2-A5]|uniref:Uncharacterized protein n=1 Tax=Funiculus sociatus GB2-A5 TaxID=2933946 RepID=A0ABV0JVW8_9CYAN|nr:hypothetical protein [Trichocoleus sp. FACHB-6]
MNNQFTRRNAAREIREQAILSLRKLSLLLTFLSVAMRLAFTGALIILSR